MVKDIVTNFDTHIQEIEEKIAYTFRDRSLLKQAFTRTSYCNEKKKRTGMPLQSNEVLEFFGDSVLSTAIITLFIEEFSKRYEYGIYSDLKEGDFSNLRSKLSDKKNLSNATRLMGLEKYLQLGEGDVKQGVANEPSVMEDLFESIIGAIYIDSGHNLTTVINSVSKMLDISDYLAKTEPKIQSYKNALQEWCADKNHRLPSPVYKTVSESGPDHKKVYERACYIGDKICGTGTGKNQKIADSAAAESALKFLIKEHKKIRLQKSKDEPSDAHLTKLKEIAAKEKKPSPEFRDIGESVRSTDKNREYMIECRFLGICETGVGESKREAKLAAAKKVFSLIQDQKKKKNNSCRKRPSPKKK